MKVTNIESGYNPKPQLYNLSKDIGERVNMAEANAGIVEKLAKILKEQRGNQDKGATKNVTE